MAKQASSAKAGLYALLNILSASGIVFANKVGERREAGGGGLEGEDGPRTSQLVVPSAPVCCARRPPPLPPSPRSTRYT